MCNKCQESEINIVVVVVVVNTNSETGFDTVICTKGNSKAISVGSC